MLAVMHCGNQKNSIDRVYIGLRWHLHKTGCDKPFIQCWKHHCLIVVKWCVETGGMTIPGNVCHHKFDITAVSVCTHGQRDQKVLLWRSLLCHSWQLNCQHAHPKITLAFINNYINTDKVQKMLVLLESSSISGLRWRNLVWLGENDVDSQKMKGR